MFDGERFENEKKNPLSFKEIQNIIIDYKRTLEIWGANGYIVFSGGNPLLHPKVWEILEFANSQGIHCQILGNPSITAEECEKMRNLKISSFQISLDGLRETHDYFRGKGHFEKSISILKLLGKYQITRSVMFTLSNRNKHDLVPLLDFLVKNQFVDLFAFSRIVPIGKGNAFEKELINTEDYRDLLLRVFEKIIDLKHHGFKFRFIEKEGELWELLYHQLGIRKNLLEKPEIYFGGCYIGNMGITILSDGTVVACRRLPIVIGKVPEQSIREIFTLSKELNQLREIREKSECQECTLKWSCTGCPAITNIVSKNYLKRDPNCWKIVRD